MITLLRWVLLKQKEIKWKLAFWQFVDKQITELIKNPEDFEKKVMEALAGYCPSDAGQRPSYAGQRPSDTGQIPSSAESSFDTQKQ
ncbi:MAG: hypothetical protein NC094_10290 [Bacteroidales bacterium]|nr:hypothetical protein [Lachnoclostridium sp.]MCM1384855.1 hypothetical protein [Lachnoclostridium sp.]MCM1465796.1 hypothetical protein [Bacteroidales bacterium]